MVGYSSKRINLQSIEIGCDFSYRTRMSEFVDVKGRRCSERTEIHSLEE